MGRVTLSPRWDHWRQERHANFCRAGAPPDLADCLSQLEAKGRQKIEAHSGRRAALAAEMTLVPGRDGHETIGFIIDPDLIDPLNHGSAYRALGVHAITLPSSILLGKAVK
jgi:hypothetical protein